MNANKWKTRSATVQKESEATKNNVRLAGESKALHSRIPAPTVHKKHISKSSSRTSDELERERTAFERGSNALSLMREKQAAKSETRTSRIEARKQALRVEKKRAQFVSSLPPPSRDYQPDVEKDKLVDVYDFESMGIGRMPLRPGVVMKFPFAEIQADARVAAANHQEAAPLKIDEKKVKSRFRQAIAKEMVFQGYDSVMKELEMHKQKMMVTTRKKKFARVNAAAGSSGKLDEHVLERAVEGLFQERNEYPIVKTKKGGKVAKKEARLSVGKNRTVKTPRGTLTTKQSALSNLLQRVRKERAARFGSSSICQSRRRSSKSSKGSTCIHSETEDLPVLESHRPPLSNVPRIALQPELVTVADFVSVKQTRHKDCASQTNLSFRRNSLGMDLPDSPSSTSYLSLPSQFGLPAVQELTNCTQATQTPGDLVSMYQKYLLNRAKRSVSPNSESKDSSSLGSQSTLSPYASPNLDLYIRELAKKHFPQEGPQVVETPKTSTLDSTGFALYKITRPVKFFPGIDGLLDFNKKTTVKSPKPVCRVSTKRSPPPVLKVPSSAKCNDRQETNVKLSASARVETNKNRISDRRVASLPHKISSVENKKISPPPIRMSVPLSPPVTLTFESPESTLVVRLSGHEETTKQDLSSEQSKERIKSGDNFPKEPTIIQCSVQKANFSIESPPSFGNSSDMWSSGDAMGVPVLRFDKCFRPPPPASLPLGWRQMQTPHELSTICEVDTPQNSFVDCQQSNQPVDASWEAIKNPMANNNYSSSSFVTLTPVSRLETNNSLEVMSPLWEKIFAKICKSPDLSQRTESDKESQLQRLPSQSTPIKDDMGFLEFEAGIDEQSFISLVGSEIITPRSEDRRVPDMNRSLSTTGDTWFTLTPHIPEKASSLNLHSPALHAILSPTQPTNSTISFMRHEHSCAFSSPAGYN